MRSLLCEFTFQDGATATAAVLVRSPEEDAVVEYTGAFSRFPRRFVTSELSTLRVWAAHIAAETGSQLFTSEAGVYDFWAR
ncbi:MAG: hypothetical protein U1G07_12450 [Verrucomicrobiota bacterium]